MSKRRVCMAFAVGAALVAAVHVGGQDTKEPPLAEPGPAQLDSNRAKELRAAAEKFARIRAGSDEALYNRLLGQILTEYGGADVAPRPCCGSDRVTAEPPPARVKPWTGRFRGPALTAQQRYQLAQDRALNPTFQKNVARMLQDPERAARIIGGVRAKAGEFPHCVAVGPDFSRFGNCCTGTLVAPRVVLTAAHCGECNPQQVYFGLDANNPDLTRTYVAKFIAHPEFNRTGRFENDIAFMLLDRPVDPSHGVPCAIATAAEIDGSPGLRLAGFGQTSNQPGTAGVLFTVDVPIMSYSCPTGQAAGGIACNAGTEIVAGIYGKDACHGDSGGPAYVVRSNGQLLLGGITSRGPDPCGEYGIYTRAEAHLKWVLDTAKANNVDLVVTPPPASDGPVPPTVVCPPGCVPARPGSSSDYSALILQAINDWKRVRPDLVPQ